MSKITNLIDNTRWSTLGTGGEWKFLKNEIMQTDISNPDPTRIYQRIESRDFIANFKFRVSPPISPEIGEAKFIFSDANENEYYRIDFMFFQQMCRITVKGWAFGAQLELGMKQEYSARILLKNNLLSIVVDEMPIITNYQIGKRSDGFIGFGTYKACIRFRDIQVVPVTQRNCFIIMPFDKKRDFLYEYVIRPTLDNHPLISFDCERADESLTTGKISTDITNSIMKTDIIIADITKNNSNVFYELGFAHAKRRKVILLIEKKDNKDLWIPFDIRDFRCYRYTFSKIGFKDIAEKMTRLLTKISTDN